MAAAWMKRVARMFFRVSDSSSKASSVVMAASRSYTREFLERGQELGHIRTDLPSDLLIEMLLGFGYATDRWLLDKIDDLSPEELESTSRLVFSVYRDFLETKEQKEDTL